MSTATATEARLSPLERIEKLCDEGTVHRIRSGVESHRMGEKSRAGDGVVGAAGPDDPRAVAHQRPAVTVDDRDERGRVAVDRDVFALNTTQTNAVNAGITAFEKKVASLVQAGAFSTSVPPPAPKLPKKQKDRRNKWKRRK